MACKKTRLSSLAVLALLLPAGCRDAAGPGDDRGPIDLPSLKQVSLDSHVVWRGSGFRIMARVATDANARTPRALHLDLRSAYASFPTSAGRPVQRILVAGEEVHWVALRDDGLSGDASAGDGVFTSASLVPEDDDPPPLANFFPFLVPAVEWEYTDIRVAVELPDSARLRVELYDADPAEIPVPAVEALGDAGRRTAHVLSLVMPPASDAFPAPSRMSVEIANRYYELTNYDPDFLATYQLDVRAAPGPDAYFHGARNEVGGLGEQVFEQTALFGSPGHLQGVVLARGGMNPLSYQLLIHELGHRWFVALDPDLGLSGGTFHWSSSLNRDYSGFHDGRYNDFELYLMGLLPPDSVLPERLGTTGTTIDDVIARHGPRTPAWPDAQSDFTLATIVVLDRLLTPAELALFEFLADEFGQATADPRRKDPEVRSFQQATGGRATMTTLIPDQPQAQGGGP